MDPEIPTREPKSFIAGETLQWSKSFEDYPASDGWVLKYSLRGPGTAPSDITATADDDDFLVDVDSATTTLGAGTWRLVGWLELSGRRHYVYDQEVIVIAAPADGTLDTRSIAKQIVDNIDAYFLAIKTGGGSAKAVKRYRIGDHDMEHYTLDELRNLRTYYWNIYVLKQRRKEFRNIRCAF